MDETNFQDVKRLDSQSRFAHKVRRFCEFCREHEANEVPDPYYGGVNGFEHVLDLLVDGCTHIRDHAVSELEARES